MYQNQQQHYTSSSGPNPYSIHQYNDRRIPSTEHSQNQYSAKPNHSSLAAQYPDATGYRTPEYSQSQNNRVESNRSKSDTRLGLQHSETTAHSANSTRSDAFHKFGLQHPQPIVAPTHSTQHLNGFHHFPNPSSSVFNPSSSILPTSLQSPYSGSNRLTTSSLSQALGTSITPQPSHTTRPSSTTSLPPLHVARSTYRPSPVQNQAPSTPMTPWPSHSFPPVSTPSLPPSSRSTLQQSVIHNVPHQRVTPSSRHGSQTKSHPDSGRLSENQPEAVGHTPVNLSWQSVEVHRPTDARRLREEMIQASARAEINARVESPAVNSSFLHRNAPPSISNRGITSLLNYSPSPAPPSTPILPQLPPLRFSAPQDNTNSTSTFPTSTRNQHELESQSETRAGVSHWGDIEEGRGSSEQEPATRILSQVVRHGDSSSGQNVDAVSSIPVVRPRMGLGEKTVKRQTRDSGFPDAIRALTDHIDAEIKRIAAEHKKSLLTVKKLMGVHRRFRERKNGSLYNAVMHKKAEELRLQGQRLGANLGDRHKAIADDEYLQGILNDPDGEEAQEAIRELEEYQLAKFQGTRASSKANDNDIVKTWGGIANTAQNLSKRTSAATFGFVCSSKSGQNVTRQFFGNGPIEGFLMSKFGMTGAEFVEAAESYFILTSSGRTATGTSIKKMQKEITKVVLEGLRDVTKNPNLGMEWEHYEVLIVKEWGVKLEGWPAGVKMATATSLHAADVIAVYHAVHSRECKWRKVEGTELYNLRRNIDARIKKGELAVPERQRRRGKKRVREEDNEQEAERLRSGKKSRTRVEKRNKRAKKGSENGRRRRRVALHRVIESDNNSNDGNSDEADGGQEMENGQGVWVEKSKARPKPKPLPRPAKRSVILSDDDEEEEEGDGQVQEQEQGNKGRDGDDWGENVGEDGDMLFDPPTGNVAFDMFDDLDDLDFGAGEDNEVDELDDY